MRQISFKEILLNCLFSDLNGKCSFRQFFLSTKNGMLRIYKTRPQSLVHVFLQFQQGNIYVREQVNGVTLLIYGQWEDMKDLSILGIEKIFILKSIASLNSHYLKLTVSNIYLTQAGNYFRDKGRRLILINVTHKIWHITHYFLALNSSLTSYK